MRCLIRVLLTASLAAAGIAFAQPHHGDAHADHHHATPTAKTPAAPQDARQRVRFPPALRQRTLAHMREHLIILERIQAALAGQAYDTAAELAEQQLGLSSLDDHGAGEVARYMPAGMQAAGTAMHQAASRFAIAARDASASGDLRPALAALAAVTAACNACHAGYRLH